MASASGIFGPLVTGISPDSWYSLQSFATDYYIGVRNVSSTPVVQQLGNVEDSTLWQFVEASSDTGLYALRSKFSNGYFCLYNGTPHPQPRLCGPDAGQFQLRNSSSNEDGAVMLVAPPSTALSVAGNSAEGDLIQSADLGVLNSSSVELAFALRSEGVVDTSAYPALALSTSQSVTSSSSSFPGMNTSTSSTSPTGSSTMQTTTETSTSPPVPMITSATVTSPGTITLTTDIPAPSSPAGISTSAVPSVDSSNFSAETELSNIWTRLGLVLVVGMAAF